MATAIYSKAKGKADVTSICTVIVNDVDIIILSSGTRIITS